jgi:hypothetical protein
MRIFAICTLAVWAAVNLLLAGTARARPPVAAAFAGSGLLLLAGLLLGNPYCAAAGLLGSLVAPVLYGALVAGHNYVSHHVVRLLLVAALAVLYWIS